MKKLLSYQVQLLAIAAVLLMNFSGVLSAKAQIDTIAIIDGGSSGSRLYVYAVDKSSKTVNCIYPVSKPEQDASKGQALSTLASNPDKVKTFLNTMTAKYDNRNKPTKLLYVLATAGMRMKNLGTADTIYDFMLNQDTVNNYKVKQAMTISGQFEGKYAWIAANYDKNSLPDRPGSQPAQARGILEIGGASMQIVFIKDTATKDTIHYSTDRTIYSKSYLGGGINKFDDKNSRVSGNKKYRDEVIEGLNQMKTLCQGVPFCGIGWALNGLIKETDTVYKAKRDYVIEVCDILGLKKEDGSIDIVPISTSWTKGAAYDIIINRKDPQPFDYAKPN